MANYVGTGLDYATPLTVTSRRRTIRSETLNLKTQAVDNDAQRWDLLITLEPSTNDEAAASGAALAVHKNVTGFSTSFDVEMPQPVGVAPTGNVALLRVNGTHGAGDDTIAIASTSSAAVTLPAGLFMTFGSHPKVYQLTSATTISANGSGTLNIFPQLTANVNDNQAMDFTPNIHVYYALDGQEGITYTDGRIVQATVSLVEALL